MTSQYQYFAFAWRHRSIVVTSQCCVRKGRAWQQWRNERSMIVLSGSVCSWHEIACEIAWKSLPNRLTRDKKSLFTVTHALFFISITRHQYHSVLLPSYQHRDPHVKVRRSLERLILNMGTPIPGKTVYIETGPWLLHSPGHQQACDYIPGHNERDGVSNHRRLDCLLNRLFRRRTKKTSKLRITDLYEFLAPRARKAEKISFWWRHHGLLNV